MSHKLVANAVLGVALSSGLIGGMSGCSGNNSSGDSTAVADNSSALGADHRHCSDADDNDSPRAGWGVSDPGVRGGPPGAGGPLDGLNVNELALFNEGATLSAE